MKLTTLGILKRGRELVASGWCQGSYAVGADGAYGATERPRYFRSPDACRFCATGALMRAAGQSDITGALKSTDEARHALELAILTEYGGEYRGRLIAWNDDTRRTQQEVVSIFDRAIAAAELEERKGTC